MKRFRRPLSLVAALTLSLGLVACASDDAADSTASQPLENAANSANANSANTAAGSETAAAPEESGAEVSGAEESAAAGTAADGTGADGSATADTAAADSAADGTRVVKTEQGDVTVPADPQRILVLNAALAGYLYALDIPVLGTTPRAVGDTEFPELWASEAAAEGTEQLAWSADGYDLEQILSLEPDLIVAGGIGFPSSLALKVYDQLSEIAPTVVVSDKLYNWQDQLSFLADEVFGKPEAGQDLVDAYDARIAEVKATITVPETPVGYLLMLADGTPYSIPENSDLSVALDAVGLTPDPVAKNNPEFEMFGSGDTFEMSTEQVGQVITQPTVFVLGFNGDVADLEAMKGNTVYNELPSFKAGMAFELPFWSFRADYYSAMDLLDTIEKLFG